MSSEKTLLPVKETTQAFVIACGRLPTTQMSLPPALFRRWSLRIAYDAGMCQVARAQNLQMSSSDMKGPKRTFRAAKSSLPFTSQSEPLAQGPCAPRGACSLRGRIYFASLKGCTNSTKNRKETTSQGVKAAVRGVCLALWQC